MGIGLGDWLAMVWIAVASVVGGALASNYRRLAQKSPITAPGHAIGCLPGAIAGMIAAVGVAGLVTVLLGGMGVPEGFGIWVGLVPGTIVFILVYAVALNMGAEAFNSSYERRYRTTLGSAYPPTKVNFRDVLTFRGDDFRDIRTFDDLRRLLRAPAQWYRYSEKPHLLIEHAVGIAGPDGIRLADLRSVFSEEPIGRREFDRGLAKMRQRGAVLEKVEHQPNKAGRLQKQVVFYPPE
jgi:hypothetical protein